ncbi:hypothetical protein BDV33DRAFT_210038 [Aspergillus novoparasiticus]|uniref:Uncharacterized protein n=1 Tax=Aspergillus novoparasiticus TaxID=986946 RepID=A0A5N6E980_9EURO|nr:hypothetical protein BDV33DRAFT_210038 [Aspergillus novoparasiticus]
MSHPCKGAGLPVDSPETLRSHIGGIHPETRRPRAGDCHRKPNVAAAVEPVSCQRFYIASAGSQFFAITPASQTERVQKAAQISKAEFIQSQITRRTSRISEPRLSKQSIPIEKYSSEVSLWMELTRWPEYLQGQNLASVGPLGSMPDSEKEPLLTVFIESVERLIHRAHPTIASHRINEFDQIQINTFFRRPGVWKADSDPPSPIHLMALDQLDEYGTWLLGQPTDSRPARGAASHQDPGGSLGAESEELQIDGRDNWIEVDL